MNRYGDRRPSPGQRVWLSLWGRIRGVKLLAEYVPHKRGARWHIYDDGYRVAEYDCQPLDLWMPATERTA
jgi:hypothetical protein